MTKTFAHSPFRALVLAGILSVTGVPAKASDAMSSTSAAFEVAQTVDCYSVGQQVAASRGGNLVQATPEQQNGSTVCRVVVVIPSTDGGRPKRAEFVVPAN